MYASIEAVISAIAFQQDTNTEAQLSTAISGLALAMPICLLNEAWMDRNAQWTDNYFIDTLKIGDADETPDPVNPDPSKETHVGGGAAMATVAAQDNQYKSLDQNQANLETGKLNNLEEQIKASADFLGGVLQGTYSLTAPIFGVMDQAKASIKSLS